MACVSHGWHGILQGGSEVRIRGLREAVAPPRRATGEQPLCRAVGSPSPPARPACTAKPARRQAVSARACAGAGNGGDGHDTEAEPPLVQSCAGAANGETPRASPEIQHELTRCCWVLSRALALRLAAWLHPARPSLARFYPPLRRLSPPREPGGAGQRGAVAARREATGKGNSYCRRRGSRGALPPLRPFTRWREQGAAHLASMQVEAAVQ